MLHLPVLILTASTGLLYVWYTVHTCSIPLQENGYEHTIRRLCQAGSALSQGTARVAPYGDLDRVLPAVLPPPYDCLPLPQPVPRQQRDARHDTHPTVS